MRRTKCSISSFAPLNVFSLIWFEFYHILDYISYVPTDIFIWKTTRHVVGRLSVTRNKCWGSTSLGGPQFIFLLKEGIKTITYLPRIDNISFLSSVGCDITVFLGPIEGHLEQTFPISCTWGKNCRHCKKEEEDFASHSEYKLSSSPPSLAPSLPPSLAPCMAPSLPGYDAVSGFKTRAVARTVFPVARNCARCIFCLLIGSFLTRVAFYLRASSQSYARRFESKRGPWFRVIYIHTGLCQLANPIGCYSARYEKYCARNRGTALYEK